MSDDIYAWQHVVNDDLWLFDKLILSKRLGYICGPKGVDVPTPGIYIVRPITNVLGMGIGAYFTYLEDTTENIPNGYFWSSRFTGKHLSVDYEFGKQVLCVEGFRNSSNPLWKWSRWKRSNKVIDIPEPLKNTLCKYEKVNIEYIGGKAIEVHLRHNPDWDKNYSEVIPVFKGDNIIGLEGYTFKEDKDYMRIGFYVKE